MGKIGEIILMFSFLSPIHALQWRVIHDDWDESSKMHFVLGFGIASYSFADVRHNYNGESWFGDWHRKPYRNMSVWEAGAYSMTVAILTGFAKEVADGFMIKRGDGFSYHDFLADIGGALAGTIITGTISYFIAGRR